MGWEEYYDYHFPDDERQMKGMKILENAMKWKKLMANGGAGGAAAKSDDKSGVVDTVTEEPVTETETGGMYL